MLNVSVENLIHLHSTKFSSNFLAFLAKNRGRCLQLVQLRSIIEITRLLGIHPEQSRAWKADNILQPGDFSSSVRAVATSKIAQSLACFRIPGSFPLYKQRNSPYNGGRAAGASRVESNRIDSARLDSRKRIDSRTPRAARRSRARWETTGCLYRLG